MQIATSTTQVNNPAAFAALMGNGGAFQMTNVFRPKTTAKAEANDTDGSAKLTKGVKAAIDVADALVESYTKLKVEVLDRSDRALWEMIEHCYQFTIQIDASPTKRETRNELIKKIQKRDQQTMASNSSTEAVVVRYVFADQSRQSRNNYMIAMEKARALGVAADAFANFLAEHGGVGKVVEKIFDYEEEEKADAKGLADSLKADKVARLQLVDRLYMAMAHKTETLMSYEGGVTNWVPEKPPAKTDSKAKSSDKADPKFEQGNFVFFVTMKNPETGKYHVVQGNVFDKAYEQQLLASIAERMDVQTEELTQVVQGLERSISFGDLSQEVAA